MNIPHVMSNCSLPFSTACEKLSFAALDVGWQRFVFNATSSIWMDGCSPD